MHSQAASELVRQGGPEGILGAFYIMKWLHTYRALEQKCVTGM